MNKQMIIAGLKARPVRTTVSILAVALEWVLILVVLGLTSGISDEPGRRTEGVGAGILLQPPNSSLFLALSNKTMPIVLRERLRELPGIKAITPVQTLVNSSAGLEIIYGIEPDTFDAVSNGFIWHKGRLFNAPDDVVVDDIYAKAKGVTVGDTVELVNHKFKVCGVVEHGKGAYLDRKSTRLNSSHLGISYAVCCLKKKSACSGAARPACRSIRTGRRQTPSPSGRPSRMSPGR